MQSNFRILGRVLFLAAAMGAAGLASAASIEVRVQGVPTAKGTVRVAICDKATFL
ncbi:DUF2141 domain-containing protein, partial [Acinetobacter baumannii]|nr:DUF2141 domain-containing protein [Acinetobacter baumannii]